MAQHPIFIRSVAPGYVLVSSVQPSPRFRRHESSHRFPCPPFPVCLPYCVHVHSCASVPSLVIARSCLPGSQTQTVNTAATCRRSVSRPHPNSVSRHDGFSCLSELLRASSAVVRQDTAFEPSTRSVLVQRQVADCSTVLTWPQAVRSFATWSSVLPIPVFVLVAHNSETHPRDDRSRHTNKVQPLEIGQAPWCRTRQGGRITGFTATV
ncbi:hypothetical protein BDU57DRAFT_359350 [Ampelomyces quisqualis]|uniref:Uncharacterized protein n=1 Tax=Ampelomyces quisqualis TaxID=50730 RepID=A0A6A5QA06_AMPQU|nr:hypothetical protein BDU57DRAFT_359350 [Ampelomyces quisqualis]